MLSCSCIPRSRHCMILRYVARLEVAIDCCLFEFEIVPVVAIAVVIVVVVALDDLACSVLASTWNVDCYVCSCLHLHAY